MLRRSALASALAATLAAGATPALAATFDVIWGDRIEVVTYPSNVGFTLAGTDIALIVNKGASNLDASEFFGATFTAASSNPAVQAYPFINNPGPPILPIVPNEALGSVTGLNAVLTSRLLPGESFRNTSPLQVIAIQVNYPPGFVGSAVFDITLTMGGERAHYSILANFTAGSQFSISFPSASRVSSIPLATGTHPASWGALKARYR